MLLLNSEAERPDIKASILRSIQQITESEVIKSPSSCEADINNSEYESYDDEESKDQQ